MSCKDSWTGHAILSAVSGSLLFAWGCSEVQLTCTTALVTNFPSAEPNLKRVPAAGWFVVSKQKQLWCGFFDKSACLLSFKVYVIPPPNINFNMKGLPP